MIHTWESMAVWLSAFTASTGGFSLKLEFCKGRSDEWPKILEYKSLVSPISEKLYY